MQMLPQHNQSTQLTPQKKAPNSAIKCLARALSPANASYTAGKRRKNNLKNTEKLDSIIKSNEKLHKYTVLAQASLKRDESIVGELEKQGIVEFRLSTGGLLQPKVVDRLSLGNNQNFTIPQMSARIDNVNESNNLLLCQNKREAEENA